MRKPAKPQKKLKVRVPADQIALKTICGDCGDTFANPTLAAHHSKEAHG